MAAVKSHRSADEHLKICNGVITQTVIPPASAKNQTSQFIINTTTEDEEETKVIESGLVRKSADKLLGIIRTPTRDNDYKSPS